MKKIFSLLLIISFSALSTFSQGIQFEESHNLNDALLKAKAQNKLVFIDAYAVWCGPCKMMSRDIFSLKEVGDYFNTHFVNLKLDMEAQENLEIAKKYDVKAYPTYLFLNAAGEVIHKGLGSMPADKFIEVAKTATDSENNFYALSKKISNGDRSLRTIKKYLEQNPYDKGNSNLVDSYFQTLPQSELYTKENWELFNQYIEDVKSVSFRYFLQNRKKISEYIGKDNADEKIFRTFTSTYYQNPEEADELKSIDPEIFEKAKKQVTISKVYGQFYRNKNDKTSWDNFIQTVTPFMNQSNDPEEINHYSWVVFENYKKFKDKNALKNAVNWAKKAYEAASEKDHIADTYANLLYESGKKKEALKIEKKALEIASIAGNTERVNEYKEEIEKFKK
ncbi:MAG: thioredoxin family protein [Paludibacteraceae bacterium]